MLLPNRYKTHKICDKVILKNIELLGFFPHYDKNQKMYDKSADNDVYVLEFSLICDKFVDTFSPAI